MDIKKHKKGGKNTKNCTDPQRHVAMYAAMAKKPRGLSIGNMRIVKTSTHGIDRQTQRALGTRTEENESSSGGGGGRRSGR